MPVDNRRMLAPWVPAVMEAGPGRDSDHATGDRAQWALRLWRAGPRRDRAFPDTFFCLANKTPGHCGKRVRTGTWLVGKLRMDPTVGTGSERATQAVLPALRVGA
jgi:hypothetical protein